jgi:TonB family protein
MRTLSYRCDRTWSDLAGQGAQRYCDRCDRVVHDLDAMSETERSTLLGSTAPACVRWVAAALVATALTGPAQAQETQPGEGPLPDFAQKQEVMGALDKTRVHRPISAQSPELRRLYEERLEKKPKLAGKLTVKFTIEGGRVTDAVVQSSTLGDPELERAILELVRGLEFDLPGGRVVVSYPFAFGITAE